MEPVSWRPRFAPPATPLTRRLLLYFRSGAYTVSMLCSIRFGNKTGTQRKKRLQVIASAGEIWCGEGDLNPHEIAPASTSS
jgi:hypothetical protein